MYAIIAITQNGARIGALLNLGLPDSRLFVIEKHAQPPALPFSEGVGSLVTRLWNDCQGFIFIMATGIVVRSIALHLSGKDVDPAVVVLDDAGRYAISLLSGHLGGANKLARRCAELSGAHPVVTTATDANDLPSFDLLAQENGWAIEELSRVKHLNACLLEGKRIAVADPTGRVAQYFSGKGVLSFYGTCTDALESDASGVLLVTDDLIPPPAGERVLVLRPKRLFLGIGCNRGTTADEIEGVVRQVLQHHLLSPKGVRGIATAIAKKDESGLLEFADRAHLPLFFYSSEELNAVTAPSPPSQAALKAVGAKGVAEPAALLASGGGTLLVAKVKSGNVTLAIAKLSKGLF